MTKRVALYLRVSTTGQTVENQRRELEAVAERHGWQVVATFEDAGISGAKGRDKRPGLDAMMKAVARREIDLIAAWSVDRLGRSLTDLLSFLGELHAKGVDLYLHQQGLDTSTPAGKAMFQMMGVFAEFEREMIRERVNAGLSRAKANGTKLGRPAKGTEKDLKKAAEWARVHAAVLEARAAGKGKVKIAKELGIGVSTVDRIVREAAPTP
ncbi:recombinase family protein [Kaistia sp. MMO-174]|uniref:recombinase family protein n=1 Tax=Kaistia sp. MMO-174 TaxID=3081256 RepID=UPI003016AE5E